MQGTRNFLDAKLASALLLTASIIVGFLVPAISNLLSVVALPALFFVVLFSLLPHAASLNGWWNRLDTFSWHALIWQQLLVPSVLFVLCVLADVDAITAAQVLVLATSSSVFASPIIADLLSLDREKAVQNMVLSTIFTPISLCLFLFLMLGPDMHLDFVEYGERVFIFLVLPFLLVLLYSRIGVFKSEQENPVRNRVFNAVAVIALACFGVGMLSYVHKGLAEDPSVVLLDLMITLVLGGVMLISTFLVMRIHGIKLAKTAAVLAAFRNVGLSFALVGTMVGEELLIFIGIAQVPMFLLPFIAQLVTWRSSGAKSASAPAA